MDLGGTQFVVGDAVGAVASDVKEQRRSCLGSWILGQGY